MITYPETKQGISGLFLRGIYYHSAQTINGPMKTFLKIGCNEPILYPLDDLLIQYDR